jgi:hypothetical protein
MSNRTLIELNHDYSDRLASPEFSHLLGRYLASGSHEDAEALERFGARAISMRHHSEKFMIGSNQDGFPACQPFKQIGVR